MDGFLLYGLLFSALVGALIGKSRRRGGFGFFLGLLLGPVGWVLIALMGPPRPPLPKPRYLK
jgi:hypothetical protein